MHWYAQHDTSDDNTPDTIDTDTPYTTYNPSPGTMEGHIIIKPIFIGPLDYVKQKGCFKIF